MKLNLMACWNHAVALIRAHGDAIVPVAGLLVFLPALIVANYIAEPATDVNDIAALAAAYADYLRENVIALALSNLVTSFGLFVLFLVFLTGPDRRVGDSFRVAATLFLFFLLANILTGALTFAGFVLFIVPGIIVAVRLVCVPAVVAAEQERSAAAALRRSWDLTKGNGWSIFALLAIVFVIGTVSVGVLSALVGVVVGLATGGEGWPFIESLVATLAGTVFQIVNVAVVASIYDHLSGRLDKRAAVFD